MRHYVDRTHVAPNLRVVIDQLVTQASVDVALDEPSSSPSRWRPREGHPEATAEDAWCLPAFWFTDTTDLTIDICTPPRLDGGVWSFVDLELDLFRSADGCAGIVDQDEFDELALSGYLTDSQVATATEVAQSLLPLVQMEAEPFGGAARAWLRSLRS